MATIQSIQLRQTTQDLRNFARACSYGQMFQMYTVHIIDDSTYSIQTYQKFVFGRLEAL